MYQFSMKLDFSYGSYLNPKISHTIFDGAIVLIRPQKRKCFNTLLVTIIDGSYWIFFFNVVAETMNPQTWLLGQMF